MKLAVVSMVRDEGDIIGAFLEHIDGLFDYAVLTDHASIDGTRQVLADACSQRPGWVMWTLEAAGYHQDRICTLALRHLFEQTDADFVVFLDADEFIDKPDSSALEQALATLRTPDAVGTLRWRNCVPERLDARIFRADAAICCARTPSTYFKVVIPRAFFAANSGNVRMHLGNHGIDYDARQSMAYREIGEILHFPIRSTAQFTRKVIASIFADLARPDRKPEENSHWHAMADRIADGGLHDEDVIGIAARYGGNPSEWKPATISELLSGSFTRRALLPNHAHNAFEVAEYVWNNPERLIASIARAWRKVDPRQSELVLVGDELRLVPFEHPEAIMKPDISPAAEIIQLKRELTVERERRLHAEKVRREMQESITFRATTPLRAIARMLRRLVRRSSGGQAAR